MDLDVPKYGYYEPSDTLDLELSPCDSNNTHSIQRIILGEPLQENSSLTSTPTGEHDTPRQRFTQKRINTTTQDNKLVMYIQQQQTLGELVALKEFNQNVNAISSIFTNLLQLNRQKRIPLTQSLIDILSHRAMTTDQLEKQEFALQRWLQKIEIRVKLPIIRVLLQQSQLTPAWVCKLQQHQLPPHHH